MPDRTYFSVAPLHPFGTPTRLETIAFVGRVEGCLGSVDPPLAWGGACFFVCHAQNFRSWDG